MAVSLVLMLFAVLIIYVSCELFINGIEWVGHKFAVADHAVASVLAAFGTALPESIITFLAVVFGTSAAQKAIGVGAALGGPLVLSTIGYACVGICILLFATNQKHLGLPVIDRRRLGQDQSWFLMIFAGIALLGCLAFPGKFLLGFIPLAIYIFYCYRQMDGLVTTGTIILERLFICPKQPNPPTSLVLLQTGLGLCFICLGSQLFISCMEAISTALGAQPHVIALLLSPIATELPEIMNTFIWIRKGKVALALGNISGSMMAQATVPSALGILFTPWLFDYSLGLAVVATMASILFLRLTLSHRQLSAKKLVWAALFYFIFCGLIFIAH